MATKHRQRPGKLDELRTKRPASGDPLNKRTIALKTADNAELDAATGLQPTDEQLEKINQFTRTPKTAEQVVVLPTWACNDLVDRDDDIFETQTLKDFVGLNPPFSPVGKSFMVGHDYTKLPVGRIFDAEIAKVEETTFLKTYSYIPNIEANKSYIENLDNGIYWAVSVGLLFNESLCTVGKEHQWGYWPWFCSDGHEKGFAYDPDGEEEDDWGYPLPVDGGEMCYRMFKGARDFYELSQVYLGAQYFAELADKDPSLRGLIKAASKKHIPVIGLGAKGTQGLELPVDVDERVAKAVRAGKVQVEDDGSMQWDDGGLRYIYEAGEVTCLGSITKDEDEDEEDEDAEGTEQQDQQQSGEDSTAEGGGTGEDDEGADGGEGDAADGQEEGEEAGDNDEQVESSTEDEEDEEDMDQDQLAAMATRLGIGQETITAATQRPGVPRVEALLQQVLDERKTLEIKAELGDRYINSLRTQAIDWYVKARKTQDNPAVKTEGFERLLDACGENVDAVLHLIEEQRELAQAKFPKAVRRSSFESDHNDPQGPDLDVKIGPEEQERVKKIHG